MRINRPETRTPQPPLNWAKELQHVLDYEKDMTYYLTVAYDMVRIYTVYAIIYGFVALKCSWAFVVFITCMICSILYVLDRAVIVSLKRHFDSVGYDEYRLHEEGAPAPTPGRAGGAASPPAPHHNYVYTTLKNDDTAANSTIYF